MKKIFFLTVALFAAMSMHASTAAPDETNGWAEIVFTAPSAAGSLTDSTFTAANSTFSVTCRDADASKKASIDANTSIFGTVADNRTYSYRLKTNASAPYLELHIPADGMLRIAARSASKEDKKRIVLIKQNGYTLLSQIVNEDAGIGFNDSLICYPYYQVRVQAGDVKISVPEGAMNFYSFAFKEEADPDAAARYYLAGSMTDWQNGMAQMQKQGATYSTTMALDANTLYQFKVVRVLGADTAWYGINVPEGASWEPMSADNCTGWQLTGKMNTGLQTAKRGDYTFLYKAGEQKEMTVVYPSEWDEIVFTAATEAGTGAFADSVFLVKYSDFRMTVSDAKNAVKTQTSGSLKYGDASAFSAYSCSLNTSSRSTRLIFNIPADGQMRIAAYKSDVRNYIVEQNGDTLLDQTVSKDDKSAEGYYPYVYVYVRKGTVMVYAQNPVNFYSFAFKETAIPETPTGTTGSETAVKPAKVIRNGRIYILHGDKTYTVTGQEAR